MRGRCLKKDARMRLRDAGEARGELVLAAGEPLGAPTSSPATDAAGRSLLRGALFGMLGLAVGVALGLMLTSGDDGAPEPAARADAQRIKKRILGRQETAIGQWHGHIDFC